MPTSATSSRFCVRRLAPLALAAALVLPALVFAPPAGAAAGDLDTSFDADGAVATDLGSTSDVGNAVVVQPDGKIVVAGYAFGVGGLSGYGFAVVRYNPNGSLDPSFDGDGKAFVDFTAGDDRANGLALQSDGKLVVVGDTATAGPSGFDFAVVRLSSNGGLDTGFGTGGKVVTDFANALDVAADVVVQPDGRIVVAGDAFSGGTSDLAVARYTATGALDPTFDGDGRATLSFNAGDFADGVALQGDGKLIVSGFTQAATADFAMARLNTNGSLDTGFDTDGKVTADLGSSDFDADVVVAPDGTIVLAGSSGADVGLARFTTTGALDPTFDTDGKVVSDIGGSTDYGNGVLVQADGKVVVAVDSDGSGDAMAIARFTSSGAVDLSFSTDGKAFAPTSPGDDQGRAVGVQPDGKLVVAGILGSPVDLAVARFLGDPAVSANDPTVAEGTGAAPTSASVTVSLSGPHTVPVSVQYATSPGTATAGSDYTSAAGLVTFAPGETSKSIAVSVVADNLAESSENFAVAFSAPTNVAVLDPFAVVTITDDDAGSGYWLAASDGGIFSFGAPFFGSAGAIALNRPIVGMAASPSGNGYWLVASDGGIFNYGDAGFFGSTGAIRLNSPIVGMAPTPSGKGYFLAASDGGIFNYGDAGFFGSAGAIRLNKPIVAMAATPSGKGYWLVASDGGIFNYGDAGFFGSAGAITLNRPIVGADATGTGKGYYLVASDGGIFNYGDAVFKGSTGAMTLNKPILGMASR